MTTATMNSIGVKRSLHVGQTIVCALVHSAFGS
jgi:hypothetical protein